MRLFLLALLFATGASAQGTGTLAGRVMQEDGVTSVIGATVRVEGTTLGARTDIDGDYRIIGVPVGTYDVMASFVGLTTQTITGVEIDPGTTRQLNVTLAFDPSAFADSGCCMCVYDRPLITNDVYQARILTGDDLERMPTR